ncbi:response regulator [Rhodoferax aquaticus]|uniref:Response regulator n=1 Tax=Rhodoferax aquaticus TaxID=2527691 RepID=A0A515ERQ4_9BURK|nr:response regulator [Rhodoferax aquaticus]
MLEINPLTALPDIHRPLILVVGDTPTMLMVMSDMLQSKYLVRVANSGKRGLDLAVKVKPTLLLLDVLMPESGAARAYFMRSKGQAGASAGASQNPVCSEDRLNRALAPME